MSTNRQVSLAEWVNKILSIHPEEIVLGLDRIQKVAKRLGIKQPSSPVIIVAGTNGKGSCVATLEKIYLAEGYKVGSFTSPILLRHNEMVRLGGQEVSDAHFCESYCRIEAARQDTLLTWFEYHTLAAFDIFSQQALDLWILEVGLGGRLDAVNMMNADVAVITSIGLDHMDRLGDTRELIGKEKAGIFRKAKPVVCGDWNPPTTLMEEAKTLGSPFYAQGKDFTYDLGEESWTWKTKNKVYEPLPKSALAFQNLSTALMTIELLQERLPVSLATIKKGVKKVSLPGRIEIISGAITQVMDVAHNPAAVAFLVEKLKKISCSGKTRAVFSMLADKDLAGSIREIKAEIDEWYVAPLTVKRAASREKLTAAFEQEEVAVVEFSSTVEESYNKAFSASKEGDRLLVFGSFHTVAAVKAL